MVRKKKSSASGGVDSRPTTINMHSRRKEFVDAEGWTHIVNKPRKGCARRDSPTIRGLQLHGGDFEVRGVPYLRQSIDDVHKEFLFFQKQWEESSACTNLKQIILEGEKDERKKEIRNLVVLGLGSLSSVRREGRKTSATQLAAVLTILKVVGREMPIFVQDPQYIEIDNQFLTSLGWTVLEDPTAFEMIDDGSLIFAVHCYRGLYDAIANRGKKPSVLIGTNADIFWKYESFDEPDKPTKLDKMIMGCDEIKFPQLRHDFSDTKIYWREKSDFTESPSPR
ncbi:hypothetical protein K3495_g1024 [Podosphaera aphanis]|nr:hypothetical protein K3495_g1024 [Podosphaera aphanis]